MVDDEDGVALESDEAVIDEQAEQLVVDLRQRFEADLGGGNLFDGHGDLAEEIAEARRQALARHTRAAEADHAQSHARVPRYLPGQSQTL